MTIPRLTIVTCAGLLLVCADVRPASAQLISPGELSEVHAELEGIRSCTSCHQLRSKGIDASLCLDCHVPLRMRIETGEGYHPAADASDRCARCHKEHFGREFTLVRWDPSQFEHSEVGWAPEGAHTRLECRDCHTSSLVRSEQVRSFKGRYGALSRTFLGLDTLCVSCHALDDPHGDQFADRSCDSCHGQERWEDPPGFDHDEARYRLTGRHRQVACVGCHPRRETGASGPGATDTAAELRFTGLSFGTCTSCHRDEHDGRMGRTCSDCHTTGGWHEVGEDALRGRFDHAASYPLEGAHAEAECALCHGRPERAGSTIRISFVPGTESRAYPSPVAEDCFSCHLDEHEGEFAGNPQGGGCDGCHTQVEWYPALFDDRRHNVESRFPLRGAHVAVPCLACHPEPASPSDPRFRIGTRDACVECHAEDDPHGGQFEGEPCDACHTERTFAIDSFDHDRARYALDGAHREVACANCHPSETASRGGRMVRYRPLNSECSDCHGGGA